jgi:aspartyl protease family protein
MPENDVSYAWKSVIKKIKKYKYVFTPIKHAEANESNVILMEKKGGVFYIDCEVNNIPLKFIFDTGASIVSLSAVEASIMIKNGSLTEDDIIGSTLGTIADGSITVGTRVILRKIKIGKYILRNIEASVSDNIDAPLLLGQSALSMLGTIEIDFENACITVKER